MAKPVAKVISDWRTALNGIGRSHRNHPLSGLGAGQRAKTRAAFTIEKIRLVEQRPEGFGTPCCIVIEEHIRPVFSSIIDSLL
jgi:hypothetical protein